MSIASEITRLQNAKSTLKTKLNAKNDEQHQITNETIDEYGDFVDSIQSSNIIGATAEGESLSLTNTKAMPYSDYVVEGKSEQEGTPSPSNPSEIYSVADDVNLFDDTIVNDKWISVQGNIINSSGANSIRYNCASNETYLLSAYWNNENNSNIIAIAFYNSNDILLNRQVLINSGTITATAPANSSYMYAGHSNIKPTTIKLQKGTVATPYSPYNQGTVTIKQRGKNLFNYAKASDTNNTYITQYRIFEIDNLKPNTHYNINNMRFTAKLDNQYCYLWDTDTYSTSNKYLLAYVNQYNTKASFISNNEGKIYLAIYPTDTTTWESVISYLENAQIEERKQFNPIRNISNTTRLHYTNRTFT